MAEETSEPHSRLASLLMVDSEEEEATTVLDLKMAEATAVVASNNLCRAATKIRP